MSMVPSNAKTKSESKVSDNVKYIIKVKTGSSKNASTDSTVSITIYGNNGKSDKITLNESKSSGKLFERSRTDEFHVEAKNVGQIKKINIGHDSDGIIKSWYLDHVVISVNNNSYKFVAKRWLDLEEGDGKTCIDLFDEFDSGLKKNDEIYIEDKEKGKKIHNAKELKEFRKVELDRLKTTLSRESSKIEFPKRKEHMPFIFNNLCPYYETKQLENLLAMPKNEVLIEHCDRITATGIVYPWIAHRMENEIPVPQSRNRSNISGSLNQLTQKSAPMNQFIRPKKSEIEGSTLTPRFPIVGLKKPKNMTGPFYVDDVKTIRDQLRKNFGAESNARQAEDKTRTVNDFYRMKLDHFHPLSMDHMKEVYHAYLGNTLGSKKALRELLNEEDSSRKSKSAINV